MTTKQQKKIKNNNLQMYTTLADSGWLVFATFVQGFLLMRWLNFSLTDLQSLEVHRKLKITKKNKKKNKIEMK